MDFVTFPIIIDDIVFPDGRTAMGVLGGAGPQTAFGMKLWADKVGLVAGIGSDLPEAAHQWLEQAGIDLTGLRLSPDLPTPRAWQLMEWDGKRTQVWRIPGPVIGQQLGQSLEKFPPSYRHAKAFHLGVHPEDPPLEFIQSLRDQGATVSIELFRPAEQPLTDEALQALVTAAHIFSPNEYEARSLFGDGDALTLVERLDQAGATVISLRQGADGSTVRRVDTGETYYIPAYETSVVDPVGAGNAYCGGFLAGWVQTSNVRLAGAYGAVAASFLIEQVGLPSISDSWRDEASQRLSTLNAQIT
ncbi:MAG: PfkB family carbohydrate kinase [Chloroflexota bacterium]